MRLARSVALGVTCAACSTEPSFETGAAASSSASSSSGATSSGATGSGDVVSSSASGGGSDGDGGSGPEGGGGSSQGPGGAGGGGVTIGSGGGGGDPAVCGDGVLQPGEGCDPGPDVVSELCVDCQLSCPTGWQLAPSGTRCFSDKQGSVSWFDAQSRCASLGGAGVRARLPVPTTQEDLDLIAEIAEGEAFLGGHDLEEEGTFRWLDGTPVGDESVFPLWFQGQPDDSDGQDCLIVALSVGAGLLDDRDCGDSTTSVCEILPGWAEDERCGDDLVDPGEECQTSGLACQSCNRVCNDGQSDVDWVESPFGTHTCYRAGSVAGDRTVASMACSNMGGAAATPQTLGEVAVVQTVCDDGAARSCWLGANDTRTDGDFVWESGEPFAFPVGTSPWANGEPGGGTAENCLIESAGALRDHPCTASEPFPVCEKD